MTLAGSDLASFSLWSKWPLDGIWRSLDDGSRTKVTVLVAAHLHLSGGRHAFKTTVSGLSNTLFHLPSASAVGP